MTRRDFVSVAPGIEDANSVTSGALLQLGIIYSLGQDVKRNLVVAHKWFNLASLRGNRCARQYCRDISSEMSLEEIAQAKLEARKWLYTLH